MINVDQCKDKKTFLGWLEEKGVIRTAVKPVAGAEKWDSCCRLWFQNPPKGYRWF